MSKKEKKPVDYLLPVNERFESFLPQYHQVVLLVDLEGTLLPWNPLQIIDKRDLIQENWSIIKSKINRLRTNGLLKSVLENFLSISKEKVKVCSASTLDWGVKPDRLLKEPNIPLGYFRQKGHKILAELGGSSYSSVNREFEPGPLFIFFTDDYSQKEPPERLFDFLISLGVVLKYL